MKSDGSKVCGNKGFWIFLNTLKLKNNLTRIDFPQTNAMDRRMNSSAARKIAGAGRSWMRKERKMTSAQLA
ncbi:MAG: hypothetical protein ABJV68_27260 [Paracoccaceae bacterium]